MPIRFRCPHCERLLGIAKRKAGAQIHCPQCGVSVAVPLEDEPADRTLREVDELLGEAPEPAQSPYTTEMFHPAPAAPITAPRPVAPPRPVNSPAARPAPKRKPAGDSLFEADVDQLLGIVNTDGALELEDEEAKKRKPVTGMDAMSLEDGPGKIVLSSQKATMLVIAAAVLMILAFFGGFILGAHFG